MLHIRVKLAAGVLVLPPGVLVDGTARRALDKFSPEGVLAYSEFTRAALRSGDLIPLGDPYDPTTTPTED